MVTELVLPAVRLEANPTRIRRSVVGFSVPVQITLMSEHFFTRHAVKHLGKMYHVSVYYTTVVIKTDEKHYFLK